MNNKEKIEKLLKEALALCPNIMNICKNKTSDAILIRDGIKQALSLINEPEEKDVFITNKGKKTCS